MRGLAGERHQPAIAQIDGALGRRRIELLADGDELVAFQHQPSVAGRILRPEAEHGDGRALGERLAHPRAASAGRISGVSPKMTRTSSAPRASAAAAASTACAVPRRSV